MNNEKISKILEKSSYNVYDLEEIIGILRSEDGCPWDKVQTHESIRKDFIEEVYEAVEAIDCGDRDMLLEELGDVLLQVVFHAQIEKEKNSFDLDKVADDVCKKLILRHPHVFGNVCADDVDTVLKNWDSIKKESKGQETYTDTLKSVPRVFPALMRAQKLGKRAARAGMDFDDEKGALECIISETAELQEAMSAQDKSAAAGELGDLLFSCVNLARKLDLDAEELLTASSDKFMRRFELVENAVRKDGLDMPTLGIEKLDEYWNEIKKMENRE